MIGNMQLSGSLLSLPSIRANTRSLVVLAIVHSVHLLQIMFMGNTDNIHDIYHCKDLKMRARGCIACGHKILG